MMSRLDSVEEYISEIGQRMSFISYTLNSLLCHIDDYKEESFKEFDESDSILD